MSFILPTCWGSLWVFWYPLCRLIIWVISSFIIFFPASSLESTTGEITFALCRSVCRDSASFKLCDTVYCIEYIFLDNISSSLSVVRARTFRFASKIERVLRIGWLSESNLENSLLNRRRFYDIKWWNFRLTLTFVYIYAFLRQWWYKSIT